jgi:hypothetical protein
MLNTVEHFPVNRAAIPDLSIYLIQSTIIFNNQHKKYAYRICLFVPNAALLVPAVMSNLTRRREGDIREGGIIEGRIRGGRIGEGGFEI